jgi:2-polyprenyl-3-methyl-5-hydroxy-6-metoxy-1,4-benzoquinol methylase
MVKNYIFEGKKLYENLNIKLLEFYDFETIILDIGCGTGLLDKEIKAINKESYIIGIDISEEAIEIAKKYLDESYLLNLDNDKLPIFKNKFDLIILGDILEHLKRPDVFLSNVYEYLNNDGKVLLSVPNIANWFIRLRLLFGNFDYYDSGILDKSHLRFFTFSSIYKLIYNANYKIVSFDFV